MIIKKKISKEFFDDVASRKKYFEVRLADWECKPGDTLILEEWDPETKSYTGRRIERKAKYVVKTKELKFFKKEEIDKFGFQVIGLDSEPEFKAD